MDIAVTCPQTLPQIEAVQRQHFVDAISKDIFLSGCPAHELERSLARDLKTEAFISGSVKMALARFSDRPAAEPALQLHWPKLMGRIQLPDVNDLLTALLDGAAIRRNHACNTLFARDGTRSVFPSARVAGGWLKRIDVAERTSNDPFALAFFAYAQSVLSHPYQDGNGRLARAMYQRSLGRSGLLSGPLLPLGPLVYANHRVHNRALQHLGSTGDWSPFVEVMLGLTRKAAAFTRHALSDEQFMP